MQFNIAFEEAAQERLRYGLAFSLRASQALPNPLVLRPKILKMNEYIAANQSELEDLRFWYWDDGNRSKDFPVTPISRDLIHLEHVSLLGGRCLRRRRTSPQEVLFLFDRLLDVYLYVEGSIPLKRRKAELYKGFVFEPGCPEKPQAAIYVSKTSARAIALRHNELQLALHSLLSRK